MRRRKRKKIEAMDIICYAAALIVVVITLYPVLHLMALSFSSSGAVSKKDVYKRQPPRSPQRITGS